MIGLENVSVAFGDRTVLKDLSFKVAPGRCLAILGPNGRGKTTALRVLIGEQKPQQGRRLAPEFVGYVPQSVNHAYAYSVLAIVEMGAARGLGLFGQPGKAERSRAMEALRRVGLDGLEEQRFDRVSGGQRQLVLLARALATGASCIVFDEPTAALDIRNERLVLSLMADLRRDGRHDIVFTTHDPNHAIAVADDALLLLPDGGRLVGAVDDVVSEENICRLYGAPMRQVTIECRNGSALTRHLIPEPFEPEFEKRREAH